MNSSWESHCCRERSVSVDVVVWFTDELELDEFSGIVFSLNLSSFESSGILFDDKMWSNCLVLFGLRSEPLSIPGCGVVLLSVTPRFVNVWAGSSPVFRSPGFLGGKFTGVNGDSSF